MNAAQLYVFASQLITDNQPFIVAGEPGVGKTQILKQICADLDRRLFISHPVLDDPSDYKGLPWMVNEIVGEESIARAEFIPIGQVARVLDPSPEPAVMAVSGDPSVVPHLFCIATSREL